MTSLATSGRGIMVLLRPARYSSPPALEKYSGEKPSVSVANTAWQTSVSSSLKKGFLRRSEWPASWEIGIRVVAFGKRLEKRRGDHAPAVMMMRVHGTGYVNVCSIWELGGHTFCFRPIFADPNAIQTAARILGNRDRSSRVMHQNAPLRALLEEPCAEPVWITVTSSAAVISPKCRTSHASARCCSPGL